MRGGSFGWEIGTALVALRDCGMIGKYPTGPVVPPFRGNREMTTIAVPHPPKAPPIYDRLSLRGFEPVGANYVNFATITLPAVDLLVENPAGKKSVAILGSTRFFFH